MYDVDIGEKDICVGCRPTGKDSIALIGQIRENAGAWHIFKVASPFRNRRLECLPTKLVKDVQLFVQRLPLMSAHHFAAITGPVDSPDMVTSYGIILHPVETVRHGFLDR